jgi:hypothetical protein
MKGLLLEINENSPDRVQGIWSRKLGVIPDTVGTMLIPTITSIIEGITFLPALWWTAGYRPSETKVCSSNCF